MPNDASYPERLRPIVHDALEETAEILSDSETLAAIEAGLAELSREETLTLADLHAELDARRSAQ
jgi:hypothetical protein